MEEWNAATLRRLKLWVLAVSLSIVPSFRLSAQDYRAQALRILKAVPLIDGHNDIPDAIRERGGLDSVDFAVPQPKLMTDIPKLRAGAVGGQFWAAYVPVTTMDSGPHPAVYALERSEEHTSELQSRLHLVCRLLLEKKKKRTRNVLHTLNISDS